MERNQRINKIYPLTTIYTKMGTLLVAFVWKATGLGD